MTNDADKGKGASAPFLLSEFGLPIRRRSAVSTETPSRISVDIADQLFIRDLVCFTGDHCQALVHHVL